MKTLSEFFYEQNKEEFEDKQDSDNYINELFSGVQRDDKHFGDCVKEINTCQMCKLTDLLNDYWDYTRNNHPVLNT